MDNNKSEIKTKTFSLKLSEQEHEVLKKGAEALNLPISQFILYSCRVASSLTPLLTDIDKQLVGINDKLGEDPIKLLTDIDKKISDINERLNNTPTGE